MSSISKHLKACIDTEQLCAEMYFSLGRLFPEQRRFFTELAHAEEKHANILSLACELQGLCALPSDTGHAPLNLQKPREIMSGIMQRIDAAEISSLHQVLPDLMRIEAAAAEGYMDEVMRGAGKEGLLKYLRQFHDDERSHFDRLKELSEAQRVDA